MKPEELVKQYEQEYGPLPKTQCTECHKVQQKLVEANNRNNELNNEVQRLRAEKIGMRSAIEALVIGLVNRY